MCVVDNCAAESDCQPVQEAQLGPPRPSMLPPSWTGRTVRVTGPVDAETFFPRVINMLNHIAWVRQRGMLIPPRHAAISRQLAHQPHHSHQATSWALPYYIDYNSPADPFNSKQPDLVRSGWEQVSSDRLPNARPPTIASQRNRTTHCNSTFSRHPGARRGRGLMELYSSTAARRGRLGSTPPTPFPGVSRKRTCSGRSALSS